MLKNFVDLKFHHIGFACNSIDKEIPIWDSLGYKQEGFQFNDPLQGVNGLFMVGNGPRIELLEPMVGSDTLTPFLNSNIKMYHKAFEATQIEEKIDILKSQRARIISQLKPAVAFGGRRVAFLMLPNRLIIELIEIL